MLYTFNRYLFASILFNSGPIFIGIDQQTVGILVPEIIGFLIMLTNQSLYTFVILLNITKQRADCRYVALRNSISAVASKLNFVFLGISIEELFVVFRSKVINRSIV